MTDNVIGITETKKTLASQQNVIKQQAEIIKLQDMRINQLLDKIKRLEKELSSNDLKIKGEVK